MAISPDDARTLSVSLFRAIETLECADTQLHSMRFPESPVTTALFRASQVARSLCESALTRIEPFYTETHRDVSESASCQTLVASTLLRADTVAAALVCAGVRFVRCVSSWHNGDEAMRAAIDASDIDAISFGVVLSLESPPPSFCKLVHYALRRNDKGWSRRTENPETEFVYKCIRVLLLAPSIASADNVDHSENTALMIACHLKYTETVKVLLACPTTAESAGAVNKTGYSALMIASINGYTEIVIALLAVPSVIQSTSTASQKYGDTALMLATRNGHTQTVAALIACPTVVQSAGAVNKTGETALAIATRLKCKSNILLLTRPDLFA